MVATAKSFACSFPLPPCASTDGHSRLKRLIVQGLVVLEVLGRSQSTKDGSIERAIVPMDPLLPSVRLRHRAPENVRTEQLRARSAAIALNRHPTVSLEDVELDPATRRSGYHPGGPPASWPSSSKSIIHSRRAIFLFRLHF